MLALICCSPPHRSSAGIGWWASSRPWVLARRFGVLVYLFLMRRMTGEMVLAAALTTVALGISLRGVIVLVRAGAATDPA